MRRGCSRRSGRNANRPQSMGGGSGGASPWSRTRLPAQSAPARNPQLSVAACPRIQLNSLNQRLGLNAGAFAVSATTRPLREPEYGAQFTRHRNPKLALLGDQPDRLDEATQRLPRLPCVIHLHHPGKLGDPLAKVVVSPGRYGWSDHAANRPPPSMNAPGRKPPDLVCPSPSQHQPRGRRSDAGVKCLTLQAPKTREGARLPP